MKRDLFKKKCNYCIVKTLFLDKCNVLQKYERSEFMLTKKCSCTFKNNSKNMFDQFSYYFLRKELIKHKINKCIFKIIYYKFRKT